MRRSVRSTAVLLVLSIALWGQAGAVDDGRVKVIYQAPLISVEAAGATLADILREVADRVGFSVVERRTSSAAVSVTINDVSVEELLRQLLRSDNYVVLYRDGGPVTDSARAIERELLRDSPADHAPELPTATDLLTSHALSSAPPLIQGPPSRSMSGEAPPATVVQAPTDLVHALAVTTRLAQRNLMTLVDALGKATASLPSSIRGR